MKSSRGPSSIATKAEDFNESYNEVVDRSGLRDKRYPVKGMDVWTPYGWAAMTRIDNLMRAEMERTGRGEVNFPLLVPETESRKEGEHIRGFEGDVYWVTRAGKNELDVPPDDSAALPAASL